MTEQQILMVAAGDRNNYGDLLFSIVAERVLRAAGDSRRVRYFGTVRSDLSSFGAHPTEGHRDLVRAAAGDAPGSSRVAVLGGEVLGSDWLNLIRFISPTANQLLWNRYARVLLRKARVLEGLGAAAYGTKRPFFFESQRFAHTPVAYGAIGATGARGLLQRSPELVAYLRRLDVVHVRERSSMAMMASHGVDAVLAPDSALVMSDVMAGDLERPEAQVPGLPDQPYMVVQLGATKEPPDMAAFAAMLSRFAEREGLAIVLCPIGLALDHDDALVLDRLRALLPGPSFTVRATHLLQIMNTVRSARIFVGTSLHGVITAQSFGVPYVPLSVRVPKLVSYVSTWDPDVLHPGPDFDIVPSAVAALSAAGQRRQEALREQKERARAAILRTLGVKR